MMGTTSLQKRLVYGLTLGIAVLWLIAASVSTLVVRQELDATFDNVMHETAQRLLPLAVLDILNRDDTSTPQRVAPLSAQQAGFTYIVRDNKGSILLQSSGADVSVFGLQPSQGFTTTSTHRLFGASALRETIILELAEPLAHRRQAARDTAIALLLPLFFLVPLSLLGIWLFVRFSLKSVVAYRQAIEARGAGNLSPIHIQKLPEEILPVADAVNRLIDRLRLTLEAERKFTANSAHELRTPLAVTLAQVQRLRHEAPDGPLQARITQIETSLKELSRLSEKMLQLAKAEGGGLLSETPQDLAALLAYIVQDLQRNTDTSVQLQLPDGPVFSLIDPDAFAILVRNLIENALKHGTVGSAITVVLSRDACLTVSNAATIIPAADLRQLTRRFVRGGSQAKGFGLGLAIVFAIAEGVGAELTLTSPATGKTDGFEVSVQFILANLQPALPLL